MAKKENDPRKKNGEAPVHPEKEIPLKPDRNPDPTKRIPGVNEPEKADPTRIEEPEKHDPTRIAPQKDNK
jgi:hypothetical protein